MATRAKSDVMKEPQSLKVTWYKNAVTINGKVHPLPITKQYILHEYAMFSKELELYQEVHTI